MRMGIAGGVLCAFLLSGGGGAGAQGTPPGGSALSMPAGGHIVITNEGPASTTVRSAIIVPVGTASSTQQFDLDITLPVLGLPLHGQASMVVDTEATSVLFVPSMHAIGRASNVVLHGPAGDATVSLRMDQPVHGFGSYDPAEATVRIRGAGGTGMFDGIGIAAELTSFFRPAGTLFLGYASPEAAVEAVQHGLAGNTALTDAQRRDLLEQATHALAQAKPAPFPPDPAGVGPPPPMVSSTIRRSGTQAQVELRIIVPAGDAQQPVKVLTVSPDGTAKTAYQGVHKPGETVTASATGTPPFVVQVYVSDVMVKQITVQAQ